MKNLLTLARVYRIITVLVLGFFCCALGITMLLQSKTGKDLLLQNLRFYLQKENISLRLGKVSGFLPFTWTVKDVSISWENGQKSLQIKKITFRPSFLPLLRKKISLHSLKAEKVFYQNHGEEKARFNPLPFYLKIRNIQIQDFRTSHEKDLSWNIQGSLKVSKNNRHVRAFLRLANTNQKEDAVAFSLNKNPLGFIHLKGTIYTEKAQLFAPFFAPSTPFAAKGSFTLSGSYLAFRHLLQKKGDLPLQGSMRLRIFPDVDKDSSWMYGLAKTPWDFSSHFTLFSDLSASIQNFRLENFYSKSKGHLHFTKDFQLQSLQARSSFIEVPHLLDKVDAHLHTEIIKKGPFWQTTFSMKAAETAFKKLTVKNWKAKVQGTWQDQVFTGKILTSFKALQQDWKGSSLIHFADTLKLSQMDLSCASAQIKGTLQNTKKHHLKGSLDVHIDDLFALQPLLNREALFGSFKGKIALFSEDKALQPSLKQTQAIHIKGQAGRMFGKGIYANEATLSLYMPDMKDYNSYFFDCHLHYAKWKTLRFSLIELSYDTLHEMPAFTCNVKGHNLEPFSFTSSGIYQQKPQETLLTVQNLQGYYQDTNYNLKKPVQLSLTQEFCTMTPCILESGNAYLSLEMELSKQRSFIDLQLKEFPIGIFSFNPFHLSFEGIASGKMQVKQQQKQQKGSANFTFTKGKISSTQDRITYPFSGNIQALLENELGIFSFRTTLLPQQFIEGSLQTKVHLQMFPFQIQARKKAPIRGKFSCYAPIASVLGFIPTGPHHIKGMLKANIQAAGTLEKPNLQGTAFVQEGSYENYYTGTKVNHIQSSLTFLGRKASVNHFTGEDGKTGKFKGSGYIQLNPKNFFPFHLEISFKKFELVHIPLVEATAKGKLEVSGNFLSSTARGKIVVQKALFSIPEKIPQKIPKLPVQFTHKKHEEKTETKHYPLYLDINVQAPGEIFVSGRGLSSSWKGRFHIGGTYDDILTQGAVYLNKGEFTFSGKVFSLTEGSLTFSGKSKDLPYLSLSGKLHQKAITIIASLRGKINEPHLQFRSLPSMPVSMILSYLIFGQDIGELTPYQVAQLAAAASTLSGQGPDIFEITRRKLRVDRLAVVSTPTAEGDKAALQVGKYLSKGILFSVTQGLDPSLGNIGVEVDLTHGFSLLGESLQMQEQGRFTLKWSHNY